MIEAPIHDLNCPGCGLPAPVLTEGYCPDCLAERNDELFRHEASYGAWQRMTDNERSAAIRRASEVTHE